MARPIDKPSSTRVLVVDDNRDAADTMALLLELEGFDVAKAHSGVDAIEIAAELRPSVVLLDLNMPGMDGFETARSLSAHSGLCIVALSAEASPGTLRRVQQPPFHGHVTKPASFDDIVAALVRCTSRR